MRDKSLDITLMLIFGISGLIAVMLTWLWPATPADRVIGTVTGSAGLIYALTRAAMLRQPADARRESATVRVKAEDKP